MNPIRRELLNGLFVLVVASLLSAAFAAFQVGVNLQLWVLMVIGVGVAVTGYVIFDVALRFMASAEDREREWLQRVGTPARIERRTGLGEVIKAMSLGSDYTVLYYCAAEGGGGSIIGSDAEAQAHRENLRALLEGVERGRIREYKRIFCFGPEVLAKSAELRSGVLRVGEGPGTIDRMMGEHCLLMMKAKGCSLYVAPAVIRSIVAFFGTDKVSVTVELAESEAPYGMAGKSIFFCDAPNREIIEQFRQMERETERHMVAVHKFVFPEDESSTAEAATG
jgi:hypothetical protein